MVGIVPVMVLSGSFLGSFLRIMSKEAQSQVLLMINAFIPGNANRGLCGVFLK